MEIIHEWTVLVKWLSRCHLLQYSVVTLHFCKSNSVRAIAKVTWKVTKSHNFVAMRIVKSTWNLLCIDNANSRIWLCCFLLSLFFIRIQSFRSITEFICIFAAVTTGYIQNCKWPCIFSFRLCTLLHLNEKFLWLNSRKCIESSPISTFAFVFVRRKRTHALEKQKHFGNWWWTYCYYNNKWVKLSHNSFDDCRRI